MEEYRWAISAALTGRRISITCSWLMGGEQLVAASLVHDEKRLGVFCGTLVRLKVKLVAIERADGLLVGRRSLWVGFRKDVFVAKGGAPGHMDKGPVHACAGPPRAEARVDRHDLLAGSGF
jgi:hypothetical protein